MRATYLAGLLLVATLAVPADALAQRVMARSPEAYAAKDSSLLVRIEGFGAAAMKATDFSASGYRFEPLFRPEAYTTKSYRQPVVWFLARPEHIRRMTLTAQWAAAHDLRRSLMQGRGAGGPTAVYVEPNLRHGPGGFGAPPQLGCDPKKKLTRPEIQVCFGPDAAWPVGPSFAWHLEKDYSQLREARKEPSSSCKPHITILDTGIRATHYTTPRNIDKQRGYNFVEDNTNVEDPGPYFGDKNSGHGPATIGILAGNRVRSAVPRYAFDADLGGAPDAIIIPMRIADSVVHFYTDEMARGIDRAGKLAEDDGAGACHVVSISMGGVASRAWADAVNFAYDNGVTIVAAAGNNISGVPTRFTVYPSRFARVITATGATSSHEPYRHKDVFRMVGNWGPPSVMSKALAAYTPNTPWTDYLHDDVLNHHGEGTSSATPQIAAAAALWLGKHGGKYPAAWQRVSAVRKALFQAAEKKLPSRAVNREFYGNGLLRAADAMSLTPPIAKTDESPRAEVWFPFWRVLLGLDEPDRPGREDEEERMYEVEALNLVSTNGKLAWLTGDKADIASSDIDKDGQAVVDFVCREKRASDPLRKYIHALKGCAAR